MDNVIKKRCHTCGMSKPLTEFPCNYHDRTVQIPSKYSVHCKICASIKELERNYIKRCKKQDSKIKRDKQVRVLLSVGHGHKKSSTSSWFDPGAQCSIGNKEISEHSVNKIVAQYMFTIWSKQAKNVQLFTAEFDSKEYAQGNSERAVNARGYDVCFFIHHNSCSDKTVNRSEILYLGPSQQLLANIVSTHLIAALPLKSSPRLVDLLDDKNASARGRGLLEGSIRGEIAGTRGSLMTEGFFLSYPLQKMEDLHTMCAAEAKGLMSALYALADMLEKR